MWPLLQTGLIHSPKWLDSLASTWADVQAHRVSGCKGDQPDMWNESVGCCPGFGN